MTFTVAIVGRPNVGKSTLFNRLAGKRLALVDDTPGVTRDRREGKGRIADLHFKLIDTAGLEDVADGSLEARMLTQTEQALKDADAVLFVIDARAGVTGLDEYFAKWLRKRSAKVILAANKCEGRARAGLTEAFSLGFGEPIAISAEHGEGLGDLYDALVIFEKPSLEAKKDQGIEDNAGASEDDKDAGDDDDANDNDANDNDANDNDERPLQLAIIGRPNVGKSTLINRLLGSDRMLTGPEAGITRDSISVSFSFKGRRINLVDTAGLRRKARIDKKLEELSVSDTLRSIRFAQVAMLVVDAAIGIEKQDLSIARLVAEEGRAIIIVLNKWDLVKDRQKALRQIADRLEISMPQVRGVTVMPCSAQSGQGVDGLPEAAFEAFAKWRRRIPTGRLNRWLEAVADRHPPPMVQGRPSRLRYITQIKTRPPTFVVFISNSKGLPEAYERYLINALRDDFDLQGTPIRLCARKGENPFAGK